MSIVKFRHFQFFGQTKTHFHILVFLSSFPKQTEFGFSESISLTCSHILRAGQRHKHRPIRKVRFPPFTLRVEGLYYLIFIQSFTVYARKVRMFTFKTVNGYETDFSDIQFWNFPYLFYFFFNLFVRHRRY